MLFSKKPEQAPSPVESFEWEKVDRRWQSTRIIATSWHVQMTPGLLYQNGPKVSFLFEGVARLGTMPQVPVIGNIEILNDPETPRLLGDSWKALPESVNGHASLSFDSWHPPQLFVTLFCTKEGMDWVSKVFFAGFSSGGGNVALDLTFSFPDEMGVDFWKTRWQQEVLEVGQWDVRASGPRA